MLASLPLLSLFSSPLKAEPLQDTSMVAIAAALVDMAQQDGRISEKEHTLIAEKFPLKENTDPVLVFTLDKQKLPQTILNLQLDTQQQQSILHVLGLVSLVDGQVTKPEKDYLLQFLSQEEEKERAFKDILLHAQKLYNRIQHEPMLTTMEELAEAQKKYHTLHKKYLSTTICPKSSASQSISWDVCKAQFANFPWVIPESVIGSYKMEATQNAFVITGTIDIDGDGIAATYVSTHTVPKPKRIGNPNAD